MKRFGQIEIITAVIMIVTSLAVPAGAGITWSGDVVPSDPSTWDSETYGVIGYSGTGTMDITGGSDVISRGGYIGGDIGGNGFVTVDGASSTWTNSESFFVGWYGDGTMDITNGGAVSNASGTVGAKPGTTGVATVDGVNSTWSCNGSSFVGIDGDGTLNITNGGAVSNTIGHIAHNEDSTSTVNVNGSGSTWTNSVGLIVGASGYARLNITGGGTVINNGPAWIGHWSGSNGKITVDGDGSTYINSGYLDVGNASRGRLTITGGGLARVAKTLTIDANNDGDSFVNMSTGGKLALFGDADDSLVEFLGLVEGTDAIRYWDGLDWADITGATLGIDYTLEYLTEGDLAGYTMLTIPGPVIPINVDIKPGSCPNPVNVKSKGMLPVAILGTEEFEVSAIDVASIFLNGVPTIRSSYEDVGRPVADPNECECTTDGPDGFDDIVLKFYTQQIVETFGEVNAGDILTLPLTGVLNHGTSIEGADCVVIVGRHKPINKADINEDGLVNTVDIAIVAENWLQSSIVEE